MQFLFLYPPGHRSALLFLIAVSLFGSQVQVEHEQFIAQLFIPTIFHTGAFQLTFMTYFLSASK